MEACENGESLLCEACHFLGHLVLHPGRETYVVVLDFLPQHEVERKSKAGVISGDSSNGSIGYSFIVPFVCQLLRSISSIVHRAVKNLHGLDGRGTPGNKMSHISQYFSTR